MARLLFCCVNGMGLGHITRTLAVARQVRRLAPDSEILVLTSSENTHVLWREGIASVKVPPIGVWHENQRLPIPQLAHAITAQVVAIFRPHVLVVDSQSAGMYRELFSPLFVTPKRVFLFSRQTDYFSEQPYKDALKYYDRILIAYKEDEKERVGVDFGDRAVWVGDILVRSADEILPRELARRRLRLGADELVFYVGLGGGGNPQNDEAVDWILEALSEFPTIRVACAAQPQSKRRHLLFERDDIVPVSHHPMIEYFSAFDAAISATGFNCGEVVHAGVPAIWTPLGHPSTDQEFNADRFASRNLGIKVKLFDTDALKAAVQALLDADNRIDMSRRMREWAGPNGAEAAARAITELLAAPTATTAR